MFETIFDRFGKIWRRFGEPLEGLLGDFGGFRGAPGEVFWQPFAQDGFWTGPDNDLQRFGLHFQRVWARFCEGLGSTLLSLLPTPSHLITTSSTALQAAAV